MLWPGLENPQRQLFSNTGVIVRALIIVTTSRDNEKPNRMYISPQQSRFTQTESLKPFTFISLDDSTVLSSRELGIRKEYYINKTQQCGLFQDQSVAQLRKKSQHALISQGSGLLMTLSFMLLLSDNKLILAASSGSEVDSFLIPSVIGSRLQGSWVTSDNFVAILSCSSSSFLFFFLFTQSYYVWYPIRSWFCVTCFRLGATDHREPTELIVGSWLRDRKSYLTQWKQRPKSIARRGHMQSAIFFSYLCFICPWKYSVLTI